MRRSASLVLVKDSQETLLGVSPPLYPTSDGALCVSLEFSAGTSEQGVYKDSLHAEKKARPSDQRWPSGIPGSVLVSDLQSERTFIATLCFARWQKQIKTQQLLHYLLFQVKHLTY